MEVEKELKEVEKKLMEVEKELKEARRNYLATMEASDSLQNQYDKLVEEGRTPEYLEIRERLKVARDEERRAIDQLMACQRSFTLGTIQRLCMKMESELKQS